MKENNSISASYNQLMLSRNHEVTFEAFLEMRELGSLTKEMKTRLKLANGFDPLEQEIKDCVQTQGFFSNQFRMLITMEEIKNTGTLSEDSKAWLMSAYGYELTIQDIQKLATSE